MYYHFSVTRGIMRATALCSMVLAFCFAFDIQIVSSQEASGSLINKNGLCLARGSFGNQLVQWTCNRLFHWWGYGKDRHIYDISGNCVASPMNSGGNTNVIQWDWKDEKGQKFTFKQDQATGYYRIVNDHGKCLSVGQNSKKDDAWIYAWDCNEYEDGQLWKWYWFGFSWKHAMLCKKFKYTWIKIQSKKAETYKFIIYEIIPFSFSSLQVFHLLFSN